jgi:hypothetical protein
MIKQGLWALSNLAAMAKPIASYFRQEDAHEDELFFLDGTLEEVIKVLGIAIKFNYTEVFREGIYFLSILSTEVTESQML